MDREGFKNRMKQYKLAREENPGLKYWEWKAIPKYDEGGETHDGGILPEIVVTPEEWQKDFSKNFADARIRKNIYRGMPVYSKLTELTHARKKYNELKKSGQLTKELITHFENKLDSLYKDYLAFSEDPDHMYRNTNDEIKRLYDIWNVADRPKITSKNSIFGKMFNVKNAHWNPINNSIYNSGNIASIVAELAHPIQYKTGDKNKLTDYIFGAPKAIYGSFTKYSPYKDKDHYEYDTHSNVEPALREYIAHGKNTKYLNSFAEGGQVEPDPLEVLERSRPKVAGIPINDKPLSGTDPIGEAMMWGLGGGAASAALRSLFPTYGATAAWLAFGGNNKDNMLVIPNNPTKNTTPIETGLLNKEVRQYYADDVLPRDIITSEADKLKFLNTDKNFEYDLYPQGYFANGVVGHYDRMNDVIRLNGGYVTDKDLLDNVMSHEVNHRYNREFPLDKEHTRILNRAYTVEPKLNTAAARAARKESEKRATNVNIRHKLQTDLRNTLGRKPTKTEMDEFIDSLSDLELLDRLGSASSYGSAYLMSIKERSDLVNQPADQYKKARTTGLRKALKYVAMNENKNDNNQNYA